MSKDKSLKQIFKPVGKYIIIHSKGEEKKTSVLVPNLNTYRDHRQWEDFENIIYAIGDEVMKVKVGDKVILDAHTKLRKADALTKIMEKETGVDFKIIHRDEKGSILAEEETEKYFACKEEDIICVLN